MNHSTTHGGVANRKPLVVDATRRLQIVDLFAGVGGLSLGAARAGFDVALAVESDKHAILSHKANFPNTKHFSKDISLLVGAEILHESRLDLSAIDGIVGGPPCQGFSVIGKRDAVDTRNNLFIKFFQLVMECQPKFFVAENVPGILNGKYESIRQEALSYVTNNYVTLAPLKLKASDYGAPTNRERVFFIGYRRDAIKQLVAKDFDSSKELAPVFVDEALRGLPAEIQDDWISEESSWQEIQALPSSRFWSKITGEIPDGVGNPEAIQIYQEQRLISGCFGTRHAPEIRMRYNQLQPGQQDTISKSVRLKLNGFCPTLRAGTAADKGSFQAVRPIHPIQPRVITPREAARLQGFPDWFQFAPSKWHSFRQIGNSVSPILAEAVLRVIIDAIRNTKKRG